MQDYLKHCIAFWPYNRYHIQYRGCSTWYTPSPPSCPRRVSHSHPLNDGYNPRLDYIHLKVWLCYQTSLSLIALFIFLSKDFLLHRPNSSIHKSKKPRDRRSPFNITNQSITLPKYPDYRLLIQNPQ